MAGLFPGICNTQNVDVNGKPLASAVLSVYSAAPSTLANCYQDIGLAIPAQNPMTADATGRLPIFYVADGVYAVRLVDATGVQIYYYPQVASIGASSSGGGGSAVDATTVFQTGDTIWVPYDGTRAGWVRLNGRTIGSATSGAAERANADCQALFLYIWANFSDTLCPVSTGRGANAAADWAANKTITTLNMQNRGAYGLDTMGAPAASGFTGITFLTGSAIIAGSKFGAARATLLQGNLPNYNLSIGGLTVSGTVTSNLQDRPYMPQKTNSGAPSPGANGPLMALDIAPTFTFLGTIGGSLASGGSDTPFDKLPPGMLGTWYWKL